MNVIDRANLIRTVSDDSKAQAALLYKCREDIFYWINHFVWIKEPRVQRGKNPIIPMFVEEQWQYQQKVINKILYCIQNEKDLHIEKSRDMGLSWTMCVIGVWGWLFHNWDCLFGSKNEDAVDKKNDLGTLFPKMRLIINKLPYWMKPRGFEMLSHGTHLNIYNPATKATISGEGNTATFGTGKRTKFIIFDEFAKWEHTDVNAWISAAAASPTRIALSTPFYKNNKFYQLIDKETGEKHLERLSVHYSLNKKKDAAWAEEERKRYSEEEWAQEQEISYQGTSFSGVFYREMKKMRDEHRISENVQYIPGRDIYIPMDFGMGDLTAMPVIQMTRWGEKINIIDYYEDANKKIDHYIEWMKSPEREWNIQNGRYIPGWEKIIVIPDPNQASNRELISGKSLINVLEDAGLSVETRWIGEQEGISHAKKILDNTHIYAGLRIIDHIDQWHYKWDANKQQYQRTPVHDRSSHACKALCYFSAFVADPQEFAVEKEGDGWFEMEGAHPVKKWDGVTNAGM